MVKSSFSTLSQLCVKSFYRVDQQSDDRLGHVVDEVLPHDVEVDADEAFDEADLVLRRQR